MLQDTYGAVPEEAKAWTDWAAAAAVATNGSGSNGSSGSSGGSTDINIAASSGAVAKASRRDSGFAFKLGGAWQVFAHHAHAIIRIFTATVQRTYLHHFCDLSGSDGVVVII